MRNKTFFVNCRQVTHLKALVLCHFAAFVHRFSASPHHPKIGETAPNGASRFLRATLRPKIGVAVGADIEKATAIHHEVHQYCFIARSVNFPVSYEPSFDVAKEPPSGT
jgi:organic hydroperoxide reductase OsmC/OhrA